MSLSSIPSALRTRVRERDRGCCQYCGLLQSGQGATFHVDHILPRSAGGLTVIDNLALQCPSCSLRKSNKVTAIDPDSGSELPLFNPRQQAWIEHFTLQPDGSCEGRTDIGRATIAALRMNDPLPRTARAIQRLLGIS